MFARYVLADLIRNPRRTFSTLIGVVLGVGLACAILFFFDGLSSSMTARSISPLAIDMQLIQTTSVAGDIRLTLAVEPDSAASEGAAVRVRLAVTNHGSTPGNEVTVRSVPGPGFAYVARSAVMNGKPIEDEGENPFASGPARMGLNIGTVAAGDTVELGYQVTASDARTAATTSFPSTISSRESILPVAANAGKTPGLADLATRIRALDGVASAEQLSFVDLSRGSLTAKGTVDALVRLFGFDAGYTAQDGTIAIVEGTQAPGEVLLSVEAARSLSVGLRDRITVILPDGTRLERQVSGLVDLSRARSLFASRLGENLELFVYVPDGVVVDTATFTDVVVPAFERANTNRGERIKSVPLREVDIRVRRDRLETEPVAALAQAERIAKAVVGVAGTGLQGQVQDGVVNQRSFLLDNLSNTLTVARDDAAVAKRLFLFLSIPGAMLAALLGAYAGIVLAGAQRRDQATLRVRGASRRQLLWMLWLRVSWITAIGAGVGLVLGYVSVVAILGQSVLAKVTTGSLLVSAGLGTVFGLLGTGAALYWTGRSTIYREVHMDLLASSGQPPFWQRYRLDLLGLVALVIATLTVVLRSGFEGNPGSIYEGRAVRLSLGLLLLPIAAWVAASLFGGRLFAWFLSLLSTSAPKNPVRPLSLLYWRSLKRRSWSIVVATLILGMIVALATSLAVFTASYNAAKGADARYTVGGDVKILPRPASQVAFRASDAPKLAIGGINTVVPVVYGVHNAELRSHRTVEVANLAALDPLAYGKAAPFDDAHFSSDSAAESLAVLADEPNAILLSEDMAEFMSLAEGDTVYVILARATSEQTQVTMKVRGLFERLPGFPDGVDAVMSIARHQKEVASTTPAFFLGRMSDGSDARLEQAAEMIRRGPGAGDNLRVDTRLTALGKDQSSLASLNINGLLRLDSAYALAMGTVTVAIFVFGLLLQRRREYVTLRAQGMSPKAIQVFIGAEAGTASAVGCSLGIAVGLMMAYYFINVLRPLFVLKPEYVVPLASLSAILGSVLAATLLTSVAASRLVNQLEAMELLRDE
jgi:putative ABC transport system permease protein